MSKEKPSKVRIGFHEYIIYWLVTAVLLVLAVPVVMIKFVSYLITCLGAPFKTVKNFIGFLIIIFIVAGGALALEIFLPYDIGPERRSVMVEENDSFADALTGLSDSGVLKGKYLFKFMAVASGVDKSLTPGRYDFLGKVSLYKILRKFKRHDIATALVTIPEGTTAFKTAGIIARGLEMDSTAVLRIIFDTSFTRGKYSVDGLEGYLFPETYRFPYGIKIDEILDVLVTEHERRTNGIYDSLPEKYHSPKQLLILASIIEAEAFFNDEMPVISSVYHNRLRRRMRLQADPTVIYAMRGLDRPLNYRDLRYNSPYNTYKYEGLPPGPINSPGIDAIKAAIHPAETDYLYFVADGTGRHVFSRTLREHNRAKNAVKKNRRASGS
jgi:UPF0755 protein